jgi:hypothetical protein
MQSQGACVAGKSRGYVWIDIDFVKQKISIRQTLLISCLKTTRKGDVNGDLMMEELMPLIANLGFPIVVSLYLLIRVERKIEELAAYIKEANRDISKLR